MDVNCENIVDFSLCSKCEYFDKDENEYPCVECLEHATMPNSVRPYKFKISEVEFKKQLDELKSPRK